MGWVMDTYSMKYGYPIPGVVTGKAFEIGGSLGRPEATGRGVMLCCRALTEKLGLDIKTAHSPFRASATSARPPLTS